MWARGRAFRSGLGPEQLRQVFRADGWWGLSAILWITTGLLRAFAGIEKGADYYLGNHLFLTKLGLLLVILLLELQPMRGLIRWRVAVRRNQPVDTSRAPTYARISFIQAGLIVVMVVLATGMARGYGS